MARIAGVLALLVLAGCAKKSDDGPSPLVAVSVSPANGNVLNGASVTLTAMATYANGLFVPIDASWSTTPEVTLDATTGMTVQALGAREGTATVTASAGGFSGQASIQVQFQCGPIWGNSTGALMSVPTDGSAHVQVYGNSPFHWGYGMVVDAGQRYLYTIGTTGSGNQIFRCDLAGTLPATQGPADVVSDISACTDPRSLDIDSLGRIYVHGQGNGKVLRYDPAGPSTTEVDTIPGGSNDVALDAQDLLYYGPLLASGGSPWITKRAKFGMITFTLPWANTPAGFPGFFVTGGLAINDAGEAFTMDNLGVNLYRYRDLDADGVAMTLPAEESIFATLPGAYGDCDTFGIEVVPNGVLVNRKATGGTPLVDPRVGIFWCVDKNGDGDALDTGEVVQVNPGSIFNGLDPGCLSSPRRR